MAHRLPREIAVRIFEKKRDASDQNEKGCFLFVGSRNSDGYGQVWTAIDGTGRQAQKAFLIHYVAWIAAGNPSVETGLHLSHRCGKRNCFNPAHLCTESPQANNSRKGCPGDVVCGHCDQVAFSCSHKPKCI